MHGDSLNIIIFVVAALLFGALIKIVLRNRCIPYTVMLLVAGIAAGALSRSGWVDDGSFNSIIHHVGSIDPHLILYLFLPTLIFESAYSMEPHLFFRIAPQIVVLAVAALIISMLLSAVVVHVMLPWGFAFALLFGTLISATDPVAVVALLKEKSSRKRLETLIDGESLLNDGSAIVFFSLFYAFASGTSDGFHSGPFVAEFLRVVIGGIIIGVTVGWVILWIIGKMINQPMIEISLSIGAAYLTFIVAEKIHVSGVVALVALALLFASIGRTRISPTVTHFLHQFWQMMAYIANTLIFLLVGIVIALQVHVPSPKLWLILSALYLLLTLIRGVAISSLFPLLQRIGPKIDRKKVLVLTWGGLRGAVSLALALSLAQDGAIAQHIREQILFLTAGIVVLTITINGSTMEWLLTKLNLDRLPAAKEATVKKAQQALEQESKDFLHKIETSPFFDLIGDVHLLPEPQVMVSGSPASKNTGTSPKQLEIAFMRQLLEIERSAYWKQFDKGYIGRHTAFILSHAVEQALDNEPVIAPRPGLEHIFTTPSHPKWLYRIPMISRYVRDWLFSRLSLGYDVARGFVEAQEEMREHLDELAPNPEIRDRVENLIDSNCSHAFEFTLLLSLNHPDLVKTLQKRSATRLLLNHKRALIWKMERDGILEQSEAQHLVEEIEQQMALMHGRHRSKEV